MIDLCVASLLLSVVVIGYTHMTHVETIVRCELLFVIGQQ